jgi:5-methylcytosine-specific restriction endonuclease McrA
MPTATECLHEGVRINVGYALKLKDQTKTNGHVSPVFRCIECDEPVKPHRGGGHASAHIEHFQRNATCSLSPDARNIRKNKHLKADYEIDDAKALEGYEIDRKATFLKRNQEIVKLCKKRDKHTCQACGFRLENNGKFIIECHHTKQLATHGEREVSLKELVCLCPTCHRIAHTRKEPFDVDEIKAILKMKN